MFVLLCSNGRVNIYRTVSGHIIAVRVDERCECCGETQYIHPLIPAEDGTLVCEQCL